MNGRSCINSRFEILNTKQIQNTKKKILNSDYWSRILVGLNKTIQFSKIGKRNLNNV